MPAPLDLTGRRFGKLLVQERAGRIKWGRMQTAWRCLCDCGRVETVPQDKLTRGVDACALCLQAACVVCSRPVPLERGTKTTCSDACERAQYRMHQMAHYYRQVQADPEHNKKMHAQRQERLAADPQRAQAEALKEQERSKRRWHEIRSNPERYRAERERARAWYAAHAQRVQAIRAARLATLDDEAWQRLQQRMRSYQRAYQRRRLQEIKADPAAHQKYLDTIRVYMREYKNRQALAKLAAMGDELMKKME